MVCGALGGVGVRGAGEIEGLGERCVVGDFGFETGGLEVGAGGDRGECAGFFEAGCVGAVAHG